MKSLSQHIVSYRTGYNSITLAMALTQAVNDARYWIQALGQNICAPECSQLGTILTFTGILQGWVGGEEMPLAIQTSKVARKEHKDIGNNAPCEFSGHFFPSGPENFLCHFNIN